MGRDAQLSVLFLGVKVTAPVAEIRFIVALPGLKVQHRGIGAGELWKTEQVGGPGFTDIVDPGNAKPYMTIFFYKEEMVIIMIAVKEKAVVGKKPETPGE